MPITGSGFPWWLRPALVQGFPALLGGEGGQKVCLFWLLWVLPQPHLDLQGLGLWGVKRGV